MNHDKEPVFCLYSDIDSISFFKSLLIIPNELAIKLKNKKELKLTVEKRSEIAAFINSKISS